LTTVEAEGWIVMRSRVSLAGRVTASGGGIASGRALRLTAAAAADERNAISSSRNIRPQYDTRIRPDGFHFFLDLPAGDYVLDGRDERSNEIEAREVSIPPAVGSRPLRVVTVDLSASAQSGADERPPEARTWARPARRRRAPSAG
jgi:hypothetical protein